MADGELPGGNQRIAVLDGDGRFLRQWALHREADDDTAALPHCLRVSTDGLVYVCDRQADRIEHHYVRDIPQLLASGDRLVFNNTKVVPAALQGLRTSTGGNWQGLFLEVTPQGQWKIIWKTRGHLKAGEQISLLDRHMRPAVQLQLIERLDSGQWLAQPDSQATCSDLLTQVGRVPLPHYIRGGRMVDSDVVNYQTIYAREPGAVAAPTAGLHFTKPLLESIESHGVAFTAVTLHVGLGTGF